MPNPQSRVPAGAMVAASHLSRYPFWYPNGAIRGDLDYDFFGYGISFTGTNVLPASQSLTLPININSDSAFMVLSVAAVVTQTDNTTFLLQRPVLVQLNEGGGARNLFNTQVHMDTIMGTAENPTYWDVPKLLLPNSTLNVALQNLSAVALNVHITFKGFKIFGFQK